jgi:hypothetical protein
MNVSCIVPRLAPAVTTFKTPESMLKMRADLPEMARSVAGVSRWHAQQIVAKVARTKSYGTNKLQIEPNITPMG